MKQTDLALGQRIKQVRKDRGITQAQAGKVLGVTYQQMQKYEAGTNRISATSLYRLSKFLNVDVNCFFSEC